MHLNITEFTFNSFSNKLQSSLKFKKQSQVQEKKSMLTSAVFYLIKNTTF